MCPKTNQAGLACVFIRAHLQQTTGGSVVPIVEATQLHHTLLPNHSPASDQITAQHHVTANCLVPAQYHVTAIFPAHTLLR
jgi:hypothetical protein